jgi:YbbR domain-containing protein
MSKLALKAVSLVCGIILFAFVNYFFANEEGSRVLQLIAPVEVRNLPPGKALIWPASKQVEITIQGSAFFMSNVTLPPPVVKVTLPDQLGDKYIARLSADSVSLPATVKLLEIKPSQLEFGIDNIVERAVKVVVPQIGQINDEIKLKNIEIVPAEINIEGPSKELHSVSQIESFPLNLSQIENSTEIELDLRNPGILSQLDTRKVKVKVEVEDASSEVSFNNLPLELRFVDPKLATFGIDSSIKSVSIKIQATKKVLKQLSKDKLKAYVLIESPESIKQDLDVKIDLDLEVKAVQISPAKVQLSNKSLKTQQAKSK